MNQKTIAVIDKLIQHSIDNQVLEYDFIKEIKHLPLEDLKELPDVFVQRLARVRDNYDVDTIQHYVLDQIDAASRP